MVLKLHLYTFLFHFITVILLQNYPQIARSTYETLLKCLNIALKTISEY